MKRKWLIVFLALSLLAGVILIAYPVVSAWYYERHQSEVCADYLPEMEDMEAERRAALWQQAEEYNRQLAAGMPCTVEYISLLNPNGDGMMGYVEISKLSVSLPIYHGTGEAVLKEGAGHMKSSSLPVGGSGTPHGHFRPQRHGLRQNVHGFRAIGAWRPFFPLCFRRPPDL